MKHRGDPIEHRVARFDVARCNVSPRHRHTQCRASFAGGAQRGGEASEAIAATAPIAFGNVESDRAESAPKLVSKVAIVSSHDANDATKAGYRLHGDIKSIKVRGGSCRSGLHAPQSDRSMTAPPKSKQENRGAGALLSRKGTQARPTRTTDPSCRGSGRRSRTSGSDVGFGRRVRTSDSDVGRRIRTVYSAISRFLPSSLAR